MSKGAGGRVVSPGGNFVVTYGHIGRFKKAAEPHQHADATAGARAQGSVAGFKGLRPPAAGPFSVAGDRCLASVACRVVTGGC